MSGQPGVPLRTTHVTLNVLSGDETLALSAVVNAAELDLAMTPEQLEESLEFLTWWANCPLPEPYLKALRAMTRRVLRELAEKGISRPKGEK